MATAVSSTPTENDYIDGVLYGTQWRGPITYSFADDPSDFAGDYPFAFTGFTEISDEQKNAIQSILEGRYNGPGPALFTYGSFSQVSGLRISLAADPGGPSDIMIAQADMFDGANLDTARVADFPRLDGDSSAGDVWFGDDADFRNPTPGTYAWMAHIHELGHAVGLSHAHDAGTDIPGFELAIPRHRDSMEFSVMTYRSYVGDVVGFTNGQYDFPQTLMMLDIAALQHLYGANYSTYATDTVYTWSSTTGEMSINGIGQGAPGGGIGGDANSVFLTVWDGGGVDTYDFSNYTENALIDLAPGGWSWTSYEQLAWLGHGAFAAGNVFNALLFKDDLRSIIENASGGSGNDEIHGNQVANTLWGNDGHDILVGKKGNDKLYGGDGNDILYGGFRQSEATYSGSGLYTNAAGANNISIETAIELRPHFGIRSDANIELSDTNPTVSVSGIGDGGHDFYAIDVFAPGQFIVETDGTFDSYLSIVHADGYVYSYNEDSTADTGDDGTSYQSRIAYTITTPGRYYVKVSGVDKDVVPVGTAYTLNITLPNPVDSNPARDGNDILDGGAGLDTLVGGLGNDTYVLSDGNDIVIDIGGIDTITSIISRSLADYSGIENLVLLGEASIAGTGNADRNVITGSAVNNKLYGLDGDDTLKGGNGNDVLVGGQGNDILYGGNGKDTLKGEAGVDIFVFDTKPWAAGNVDEIVGFNVADDTIWLENSIFTALGKAGKLMASAFHASAAGKAHDVNDRVIYETDTGNLFYDHNGHKRGGSVLVAHLDDHLSLSAKDFWIV
ncbi:M10 family metallopeptidase C-terminal domain-containing protein [Rhizobium sp. KVB221]|uniref:M10 family metallopeptidase C-terminal domain-containing protein n=1 Tax=Rhizobium setariae TaxID=2801340 RepID=A0A936YNL7_9HYPH|nr:M10 family metallopeptidase [Rhizobium setariae]MBL0373889.1 M10 family metallopeptidase C-terminal domain-containing protein [Rhizobium setariae]